MSGRWVLLLAFWGVMGVRTAAGEPPERLRAIEPMIERAIDGGDFPGCVVQVQHRGETIYQRAFGHRQLEPTPEPMTIDTIFDMASITKPVATATSVMLLVQKGAVALRDPVAKHLPEFGTHGKEAVTVFECLTHQAGFVPDSPLDEYREPAEIWPNLCRLELSYPPRSQFVYSDVGFQVLGKLVERVSGQSLDEFTRKEIFEPLGMRDSGFRPGPKLLARVAPTEQREGEWIRGDVHDPRSFAMGNVAGHAGLFSTAEDISRYAQMMLNGGRLGGLRLVGPPHRVRDDDCLPQRSFVARLGWDKQSRFSYTGVTCSRPPRLATVALPARCCGSTPNSNW